MMTTMRFLRVLLMYFSITILYSNDVDLSKTIPLDILTYNNISYISLNEFIVTHGLYSNYYDAKDKLEIIYNRLQLFLP